jgi:hypothetical protein
MSEPDRPEKPEVLRPSACEISSLNPAERGAGSLLGLALKAFAFLAVSAGLSAIPSPSYADYQASARWFASKSEKDRVVLQGMLILVGGYQGLIDGVFGKNTYEAIVDFERSHGLDHKRCTRGLAMSLDHSRTDPEGAAEATLQGCPNPQVAARLPQRDGLLVEVRIIGSDYR